jgi:hypothetical protein
MGIPRERVIQLRDEGITGIDDLGEVDMASFEGISAKNFQRPTGGIPDPATGDAAAGATIPTPPFMLGVKSLKRLTVVSNLLKYYEMVGRVTSVANVCWDPIVKEDFEVQWEALETLKDGDDPDVSKINTALSLINWTETVSAHLKRKLGFLWRMSLLGLMPKKCKTSDLFGTMLEDELIVGVPPNHASYHLGNSSIYCDLDEATRSTQYATSVDKLFRWRKDVRHDASWLALANPCVGNDKWEADIKCHE